MSKDPFIHVEQICLCLEQIERYTHNQSKSQFLSDLKTQDAVIRRLQILGESVKALPKHLQTEHPEIPWSSMSKMRDILVHHYLELNLERVWNTVQHDLPPLKQPLSKLLSRLKGSSNP